ncbi:MAG: DUF3090 family protein [Chloroflexi bacterium]|nr:DUF3090 family protein [Chloroflexota bacterium]
MEPGQTDLGEVDEIDVEAIGEPGHRTFRLLLASGPTTVCLWLEKEQLEQLAVIIEQQVARATRGLPTGGHPTLDFADRFPASPTMELKAGRMAVGFDEDARRFAFTAEPVTPAGGSISFVVTQIQAEALSLKIAAVASAGRPRCPLCGAPIETGVRHVCPASNGHVEP